MIPPLTQHVAVNGFIDIYDDIAHFLRLKKEDFNTQILSVPSKQKYFINQIESNHSKRFSEWSPRIAHFDNDIDLREFFNMGWDHGENGLGNSVAENLFKWDVFTLEKVKIKYQGETILNDYYLRLNEVAKSEFFYGVVCVYFYYWLKEGYDALVNTECTKVQEVETSVNDATGIIGYKWQGKDDELDSFYTEIKGIYIHKDTSLNDFCTVFSGCDTSQINKVKWVDNNATEVLVFILEMMEAGLIKKGKSMNYMQLKACFCKPDGSPFIEQFKNLYQPVKNGLTKQNDEIKALMNRYK